MFAVTTCAGDLTLPANNASLDQRIMICMTDDTARVLAEQVVHYPQARRRVRRNRLRRRGRREHPRIERLVTEMRPTGAILEIAGGTGMWTAALAGTGPPSQPSTQPQKRSS